MVVIRAIFLLGRLREYQQKKREPFDSRFCTPPQGVAYTRTEWRRTNNLRTWFAIGFDFLSKSCLTLQTYILSLTILFLQIS